MARFLHSDINCLTPSHTPTFLHTLSGPLRFEYEAAEGKWRTTRGRRELFSLLAEEVHKVSGVDILQGHT
jgi:frataxin-like iron-binding protein CyaY